MDPIDHPAIPEGIRVFAVDGGYTFTNDEGFLHGLHPTVEEAAEAAKNTDWG